MSEGIPKSVRDALARQTAADAHPSADVLNAYAERSLSDEENRLVLAHLAACADCRDVVFLASGITEQELLSTAAKEELVAARIAMPAAAPGAKPAVLPQAVQAPHVKSRPQSQAPRLWWKWAMPVFAAVIAVSIGLLERGRIWEMMSPPAQQTAKVEETPAAVSQPTAPKANSTQPSQPESSPKPSESRAEQAQTQPSVAQNEISPPSRQKKELEDRDQALKQRRDEIQRQEQAQLSSSLQVSKDKRDMVALGGVAKAAPASEPKPAAPVAAPAPTPPQRSVEVTSAAPLVQADNADLSTNFSQALVSNSAAGATLAKPAAPTRWRVSSDGHVEHTVGPSTWERVMSAEPATFHVVAIIGQNVWAGGSDGALFHSADGGHEWNRVALAGEQGTIASIRFNNAQQGSLTTEAGTTWKTTDGGTTWTKQ